VDDASQSQPVGRLFSECNDLLEWVRLVFLEEEGDYS
jgi:hypothetical protein